jgi:enoyl-CoA hydratase/3-hydroxyacyl-CoA dehydrogenase
MSQISKVGVIGAGNMGSGIVQKLAQEGLPVVMVDLKQEFVQRGMETIRRLLEEGVARRLFTPEQVAAILARIQGTTDFQAVADADLVIEAVFEDQKVKRDLFAELDRICAPKTILATNTSSFYVREFAEKTGRPDRFIGLHYFYHPAKNRLLEVIPHAGTSPETLAKALAAAKLHGKTAIVVKDAPGFAVNRFFVPFLNEAARMLAEGMADIPTIEEAAKRAFKIGMGPFELMNVTGIPIAVHSSATLGRELGPFYATAPAMKTQMEKKANWDLSGRPDEAKIPPVVERLYGVCLGVAAALVDEGVATIEDTDRGAKIGLRWAMGPFEIMNAIGIERTYRAVEALGRRHPDFKMPAILEKQFRLGTPFAFNFVDLAVGDGIATITLNRPEAMNALNETVVDQLAERFARAEADPAVKAIVFQGAGKAFVAGADIRYFVEKIKAGRIADIVAFTRRGHELFLRIEESPKVTIALLDGLSMGGGSELALACQAIVATPAGSMAFPETGIGIFPGLGGMLRLARHVGPALAKYFVFTGATLRAADAQALGIVSRLVEPAGVDAALAELAAAGRPDKYRPRELPPAFQALAARFGPEEVAAWLAGRVPEGPSDEQTERIAKALRAKAPIALRIANAIIDRQAGETMHAAVETELGRLTEIFSTQDALEGLASVGRKRPEFRGA